MSMPIRIKALISILLSLLYFYGFLFKAINDGLYAGPPVRKIIFDEIIASVHAGMNSFEMLSSYVSMLLAIYSFFFALDLFKYSLIFLIAPKKRYKKFIQDMGEKKITRVHGLFDILLFLIGVLIPGIFFFAGYIIPLYQHFSIHGFQLYSFHDLLDIREDLFYLVLWFILIAWNFILSSQGKFHLIINMTILKIYQTQDLEQKNEQQA